jgi:hypothetical protein
MSIILVIGVGKPILRLPWYASQFIEGPTLHMAVAKEPLDAA